MANDPQVRESMQSKRHGFHGFLAEIREIRGENLCLTKAGLPYNLHYRPIAFRQANI
jgi:hypothetical protein